MISIQIEALLVSNNWNLDNDVFDSFGVWDAKNGNVKWVHKDINFMKYTLSNQKFIDVYKKIGDNFDY